METILWVAAAVELVSIIAVGLAMRYDSQECPSNIDL